VAIEKAALRAADLTRQLLAYAGKGKYVVTEVDLDIVVKEVNPDSLRFYPKNVILCSDLADRLPFVRAIQSYLSNPDELDHETLPNLSQQASRA